jgi:hypothetical protein
MRTIASMRLRILASIAIGAASGVLCWFLLSHFHQGAADFGWAVRNAQFLLQHKNPYNTPLEQYPMTAAIFGLPFVWVKPEIAGGVFYGISSALLAFGITRYGFHRLLIFLSLPYCIGILTAQWGPLITASAFFPLLLPATMAKPQIGLPVVLTHLSRKGVLACLVVLAASLIAMPRWPWWWVHQFGNYGHFIPIFVLPGPLLLLALLCYHERDAWLLFLMALTPQRWFYDTLVLWIIPKTRRELVWTAFFSFGAGILRWYHQPHSYTQVGRWTVIFIYLPMLAVVLLRARSEIQSGSTDGEAATARVSQTNA